jgi:prepilin peptidase CpaA
MLLLTWAAINDLRCRRIPNWLTLTLIVTGIILSFTRFSLPSASGEPLGATDALLGLLAGFTLPFVLFAIGAMGAGDVKLFAGIGAWLGPGPVLAVFALAAIVGGIIVLAQSLRTRQTIALLKNTLLLALNLLNIRRLGVRHVSETGKTTTTMKQTIPYAIPVWVATMMVLFTPVMSYLTWR